MMSPFARRAPFTRLFGFAALILAASAVSFAADGPDGPKKKQPEYPAFQKGEAAGGSLKILQGVPVLHLKGTPEQMGTQAGTLLKEHINYLLKHYFPHFIQPGHKPEALAIAHKLEKEIPERYITELKACAKAAGAEYEDILLANVSPEVFEVGGCSVIAVGKTLTEGGQVLFGRNLDWNGFGMLQNFGMVTAFEPDGQQPFVSVGYPGMVGCVTAMNDAGVCVADLVVLEPAGDDITGIPYLFLLRKLMEEAKTAEDGEHIVQNVTRTVPHNIFLADRHTARLFECEHKALTIRKPEGDILAATNYFGENAKPNKQDERYCRLCASLGDKPSQVNVAGIEKALKSANLPFMNLHSVVMQPEKKVFHVAQGKVPAAACPFKEMHWEWCFGTETKLDPAPEDPPAGEGDKAAAGKAEDGKN